MGLILIVCNTYTCFSLIPVHSDDLVRRNELTVVLNVLNLKRYYGFFRILGWGLMLIIRVQFLPDSSMGYVLKNSSFQFFPDSTIRRDIHIFDLNVENNRVNFLQFWTQK